MQELTENLYIETDFYGGTVGAVVTQQGIVCIDTPPLPNEARRWRSQLAHLTSKPITLVINTCHNPARILGNRWFNAPVITHQYTAQLLNDHPELFRANYVLPENHDMLAELNNIQPGKPEITFSEAMEIHRGDLIIEVIHRSGASAAGAWVRIPAMETTFIGDTIISHGHPQLYSANIEQWFADLNELSTPDNPYGLIVVGKGQPTYNAAQSTGHLTNYLHWLQTQLDHLLQSDKTEEELIEFVPTMLANYPVSPAIWSLIEQRLEIDLPSIYNRMLAEIQAQIEAEAAAAAAAAEAAEEASAELETNTSEDP